MTALADVIPFLAIFCAGIAAGTWVVAQRALIPMRRELSDERAVHHHVVTSREIDRYQPKCAAAATVSGILILALGLAPDRTASVWTAAGVLFMLAASLTSLIRNMPINRRIASWPPGVVPEEFPALTERWDQGNLARTILGVAGFASYVIAVI